MEDDKTDTQPPLFRTEINPPVFFGSAALILLLVLFGTLAPEKAGELFTSIQTQVTDTFGWFYVLVMAGFFFFVSIIALSKYGNVKLGPDHSRPDYSYVSWFAMLFSAGMGIGLMFFGVAEPVMHFSSPPEADPLSIEAARDAMRITFLHWGLHGWAAYAVIALSLAYFSFRHNLPLTIRSGLYPLIGDRINGWIGHLADTLAVLGTLFGVATSLGFGVMQVNAGLNYLFGLPVTPQSQIVLICIITAFASISVGLGLDGGIRRISEANIILAICLLLFVIIAGPTTFIAETFVQNIGIYATSFVESTFNLYAYKTSNWMGGWTLFYWGWWIAWAPFVGMFIARVSRGRTIREFVIGVLFVPVGFTFLWLTAFGDTALHMVIQQGIDEIVTSVAADTSVALFQFLEHLPFSTIVSFIATLLVITFFVTSSDSGSLVVDTLTSGGELEAPLWQRLFWAWSEGAVAIALLLAGGLGALQAATIASALPFSLVMICMCWGLAKSLQREAARQSILSASRPGTPNGGPSIPWQRRLKEMLSHTKRSEVDAFLERTIEPAFRSVQEELKKRAVESKVGNGSDGSCWIEIGHGDEPDFYYSIHPIAYQAPAFTMQDTQSKKHEKLSYFRPEVYLKEGGQDYEVMNWSKDEVIHDVLHQYESHLKYMEAIR